MLHLDLLLKRHPALRSVDYQRLVQRAKLNPEATWAELVEASIPIVYTAALRLADDLRNGPGMAEEATREVFEKIRDDDFAILRGYVGLGKWPSLLVRLTQKTGVLSQRRREHELPSHPEQLTLGDPDQPIPALDAVVARRLEAEGERFLLAMRKVIGVLHRRDRLLLSLRYEQGLTLRELDKIFGIGSAHRVGSILDRLADSLQPLHAVSEAWGLDAGQKHAVLREIVVKVFEQSMESSQDRPSAPALQQH
jgi:DNA-directed RNA polymerase specialized sigma24 family protein